MELAIVRNVGIEKHRNAIESKKSTSIFHWKFIGPIRYTNLQYYNLYTPNLLCEHAVSKVMEHKTNCWVFVLTYPVYFVVVERMNAPRISCLKRYIHDMREIVKLSEKFM